MGCNGRGQTHKYREKAEATVGPVLSLRHPGSPVMLSKNQSKRASKHTSYCSIPSLPPNADHAQKADSPKASWLNEFPQQFLLLSKPNAKLHMIRTNIKYYLGERKGKNLHKNGTITNLNNIKQDAPANVQSIDH